MGGRSVKCDYCERWFLATYVPLDHIKAKHPEKLDEYRTARQMRKIGAMGLMYTGNPDTFKP
jgi:hypothetical protein